MKICLYTALYDNYHLLQHPKKLDGVDYICFTDNEQLESDVWDIRYIPNDENITSSVFDKRFKCLPHLYLNNYNYSIWLDVKYTIIEQNYISLIFKKFDSKNILLYKHSLRNCIYIELRFCMSLQHNRQEDMFSQVSQYKEEQYPNDNGLYQSEFLLRNQHDTKVCRFNELWYNEINKWGVNIPQDQLSLPYSLWKVKVPFNIIEENIQTSNFYNIKE